jgi:hypothetical protein
MTTLTLDGHAGTQITIDLCSPCQTLWFDTHESLQLAPASTLTLFGLIGDQAKNAKRPIAQVLRCPRCGSRLLPTHDRQRDTPFEYWRCDCGHGRFITFFNFLREKSFVRTLSAVERDELSRNIQIVNCSNCGAPIDLVHASACAHCGSPVSMLDMKHAELLVAQLQHASAPKPIDPALPLNLLRARREVDAAFATLEKSPAWWSDAASTGLVEASVSAIARWLKRSS